jgi:hypothetical protein
VVYFWFYQKNITFIFFFIPDFENALLEKHEIGKRKTQKIERKHLGMRTRIKRLQRKTICYSRLEEMHDIVIGLFINRYEFGEAI